MELEELAELVDVRQVPSTGLWRVGRQPHPLRASRLDPAREPRGERAGNRWDSTDFEVLYCATTLEGCFGETLARFRAKPFLADLVEADWQDAGYMKPNHVPRDWRDRRTAVHISVDPAWPFLDVESLKTRMFLQEELALGLAALGVHELDVPEVRGRDRRVTQLISEWAYHYTVDTPAGEEAPFAGIYYTSRVSSDWECWAIFEGVACSRKSRRYPSHTLCRRCAASLMPSSCGSFEHLMLRVS